MNLLIDHYKSCICCGRECKLNRYQQMGTCKNKNTLKVSKVMLYYDEEPCISGYNGSGAIFFSGCSLNCIYCQNKEISHDNFGKEITIERLSQIMLELQEKKAENINLVTPTHFIPSIKEAIIKAKKKGLEIPIVYNSSGYDHPVMLKELEGLVDIYLVDFKYYDDLLGEKLSKIKNYSSIAKKAIEEMVLQTGENKFENGKMVKGVLVRHLCLPTLKEDSKKILSYLYRTYQDTIYFSIMNQYTPVVKQKEYPFLNQKLAKEDYDEIIDFALSIGIHNAYMQENDTASLEYIPSFDLEGV